MNRTSDAECAEAPDIIAADDNKNLLLIIKSLLESEGYQVRISWNANDISKMIGDRKPGIILMDIQMDGANGAEICRKLKEDDITSDIPVIMISGNENLEEVIKICRADSFLYKPFDLSGLLIKINYFLSRNKHKIIIT